MVQKLSEIRWRSGNLPEPLADNHWGRRSAGGTTDRNSLCLKMPVKRKHISGHPARILTDFYEPALGFANKDLPCAQQGLEDAQTDKSFGNRFGENRQ